MSSAELPVPMIDAARRAMTAALDLAANDKVLVIGDDTVGRSALAFAAAAEAVGCTVSSYELPTACRPLTSLPPEMVDLLPGITVVINAIDGRSDEVPFRIEWIKAIEETGCIRLGHCPGITEAMMTGGSLDVDYAAMHARAKTLTDGLAGAERLHITTAAGTDLMVTVAGRSFINDLAATVTVGVNLPCGELYCAPVENDADGLLVIDGPVGGDGNPPAPVRITVVSGRVVDVACNDADWQAMVQGYMAADAEANVICELGIGLNPGARLAGRMLEDEKALRTAHIAFGSNEGMPGGQSVSCMHIDYLIHRPTISVVEGESERPLLVAGDLHEN